MRDDGTKIGEIEVRGYKVTVTSAGHFVLPTEVRGDGYAFDTLAEAVAALGKHLEYVEKKGAAKKKKVAVPVLLPDGLPAELRGYSRNSGKPELYVAGEKVDFSNRDTNYSCMYPAEDAISDRLLRIKALRAEVNSLLREVLPYKVDISQYTRSSEYATVEAHDALLDNTVSKLERHGRDAAKKFSK